MDLRKGIPPSSCTMAVDDLPGWAEGGGHRHLWDQRGIRLAGHHVPWARMGSKGKQRGTKQWHLDVALIHSPGHSWESGANPQWSTDLGVFAVFQNPRRIMLRVAPSKTWWFDSLHHSCHSWHSSKTPPGLSTFGSQVCGSSQDPHGEGRCRTGIWGSVKMVTWRTAGWDFWVSRITRKLVMLRALGDFVKPKSGLESTKDRFFFSEKVRNALGVEMGQILRWPHLVIHWW